MGIFVSKERIHVHRVIVPVIIIMLEVAQIVFNTRLESGIGGNIAIVVLYVVILIFNVLRNKNVKKRMQETRNNH